MEEKIQSLFQEINVSAATDKAGVEAYRLRYTSKKGVVGDLFEELKQMPVEQKKTAGKILNELKQAAEAKLIALQEQVETSSTSANTLDLTLPPIPNTTGNLH